MIMGYVKLWVDVFPKSGSTRDVKTWDIEPRPPALFEARLIIWGTEDVEANDVEGTSDIYIRAWVNDCKP